MLPAYKFAMLLMLATMLASVSANVDIEDEEEDDVPLLEETMAGDDT
jgi:hypothetical protein